ncbi:CLUMA_CG008784, isoform A [Clunio marinus]|uniref:CLUMA_CG008784, isoform A n=1 Tax=Clunio marinus TaxID=568069 RepID=A0A1J1I4Y4_9DIPT|nr:CLUMA_CG008784, isoform A [Clunio marinus]
MQLVILYSLSLSSSLTNHSVKKKLACICYAQFCKEHQHQMMFPSTTDRYFSSRSILCVDLYFVCVILTGNRGELCLDVVCVKRQLV